MAAKCIFAWVKNPCTWPESECFVIVMLCRTHRSGMLFDSSFIFCYRLQSLYKIIFAFKWCIQNKKQMQVNSFSIAYYVLAFCFNKVVWSAIVGNIFLQIRFQRVTTVNSLFSPSEDCSSILSFAGPLEYGKALIESIIAQIKADLAGKLKCV